MKRALQEFIFSNPKSQVPSTFCFIWERVNDTSAKKTKQNGARITTRKLVLVRVGINIANLH